MKNNFLNTALVLIALTNSSSALSATNFCTTPECFINQGIQGFSDLANEREQRKKEAEQKQRAAEKHRLEQERLNLERERLALERQRLQQQQQQQQQQYYAKDWTDSTSVISYQGYTLANLSVPQNGEGYKQVYFSYNSSRCKNQTSASPAGAIYINNIIINFTSMCNAPNSEILWASSYNEAQIINKEFIKKKVVVVESGDRKNELVFSAKGFTKQWNRYN